MNNEINDAIVTLKRARESIIREIARSGAAGGYGRALNQAENLNAVCSAIEHAEILKQSSAIAPTPKKTAEKQ